MLMYLWLFSKEAWHIFTKNKKNVNKKHAWNCEKFPVSVVPQTTNECLTDNPVFVIIKIKLNKTILGPNVKVCIHDKKITLKVLKVSCLRNAV